jgi:hypothetical protein
VRRTLRCGCGHRTFTARQDRDKQACLLTCGRGHHSLLLDSRDYWGDVIQEGRPPVVQCRCKGRLFEVSLAYAFVADRDVVSAIDVHLDCIGCGKPSRFTIDIDYEPTHRLIEQPLDPCEDPWLKARQVSLTGYWQPEDLHAVIRHAIDGEGARAYLVMSSTNGASITSPRSADELITQIRGSGAFDVFFASGEVVFPKHLPDLWKKTAVVHVSSGYDLGIGELHYVDYAHEIIEGTAVVAQPAAFLELASRIEQWLRSNFVSDRWKTAIDNPDGYRHMRERGLLGGN